MNDDTRLREGLEPCGSPEASVAAGGIGTSADISPAAGGSVYAALDLGTNNCRLLIACPTGDGFRVVDSFSRIIRLGEGVSATGCISDAAIERAIAALSICRDKIHLRKAKRLRLIATEACRAASNAQGFRDRVAAETGIRLEAIDRETEAALAVIGCSPLLDPAGRGALPFDIACRVTRLAPIAPPPHHPTPPPRPPPRTSLATTIARLLRMSYSERAGNNCISVERADLVLAGCAILDAIRNAVPLKRLRVADRGLREGMLVEMMREDGAIRTC